MTKEQAEFKRLEARLNRWRLWAMYITDTQNNDRTWINDPSDSELQQRVSQELAICESRQRAITALLP